MIKKIILLVVVYMTGSVALNAQENSSMDETTETEGGLPTQGAYFELMGNGGIYSFNYERFFVQDKINISGRIGFGLFSEGIVIKPAVKKGMELTIPFGVNLVYPISGAHNAEFGLGATFYTHKVYELETSAANINSQPIQPGLVRKNDFWPNLSLGYRYQKESGLYYRGFFNAHLTRRVLADDANSHSQYSVVTFDPWAGLSIGLSF